MRYAVKEIYQTLQGEGYHAGRPAVLLRFAGCNLWSGREADRARAVCRFCDTDFAGTDGPEGGSYPDAHAVADAVAALWPDWEPAGRFVVCTGGEPLLQLDRALVRTLHRRGFEVAVETNGTISPPAGIDWICVSPKAGDPLVVTSGDELKLVHPQEGAEPDRFIHLDFAHFYLQPMDGPHRDRNTGLVCQYAACDRRWKVSIQTHKYLGIP